VKLGLSGLVLFLSLACSPSPPASSGQPAAAPPPAPPREPANVMSWKGADWLEREDRAEKEKPEVVIRAMHLKDGDQVADIGAGTGFFSRRLARAVAPTGKVYANDIQPEMLERLKEAARQEGLANIVPVLGTATDPGLPKGRMDWVLLVDVYHEFQDPQTMLAKIRESLKPDGRVALVEYRAEGDTASHISREHRMSVEQVLAEWLPAGFELESRIEDLPSQHLFVFTKRRGARTLP
jgi:ubiquinone/menaquinone biosynthesis C-methylase UbiE